jgi:DNA-binding response OmpR family regulator
MQTTAGNVEKKKILIVEDEISMLRILLDTFKKENFSVVEARDGESAFSKALSEKPDIILLDILLPKIDGLSVLKKLRNENEYGKNVPVILLTNISPDREEINKVIAENDPAYYLIKTNWNIEDIVSKVKERLSRTS